MLAFLKFVNIRLQGFFRRILFFTFFLTTALRLFSQTLVGTVSDVRTHTPIPFAILHIGNNTKIITDTDGEFIFQGDFDKEIIITHPQYDTLHAKVYEGAIWNFELYLRKKPLIINQTNDFSSTLMRQVLDSGKIYNPRNSNGIYYKSYMRLQIDSDKKGIASNVIEKVFNFILGSNNDPTDVGNHHLFFMESSSNARYLGPYHRKEIVEASKVSGVENSSFLSLNSNLQTFTVYDPFVSLGGPAIYLSPANKMGLKRYFYSISDTLVTNNHDSLLLVHFSPKPWINFSGLSGMLLINPNDYSIRSFYAFHPKLKKLKRYTCQTYDFIKNKIYPEETVTEISSKSLSTKKVPLTTLLRSYVYDVEINKNLKKADFDEFIFEISDSTTKRTHDYWKAVRQRPLDEVDSNTYQFYSELGNIKGLDKLLYIGERIYYGQAALGKLNFDLNKLLNYNDYEGLRLGVGVHTNYKFSKKYTFGAYYGYGLHDLESKFGCSNAINFKTKYNIKLNTFYQHDLSESGIVEFNLNKIQYSSEPLRKYRIAITDKTDRFTTLLTFKPAKYFRMNAGLNCIQKSPAYFYTYKGVHNTFYNFTELSIGFRYAYGEKYFKSFNDEISLSTEYPILFFQYTKGIHFENIGKFDYSKIDIKLMHGFKFFGFGHTNYQMAAGYAVGELPYTLLYTIRGGLRNFTPVFHNTFETMKYNEFLSDKYATVFLNHNFGKLLDRRWRFNPELSISQNMGIGYLSNVQNHGGIHFKEMNHLYLESGLLLGKLVNINFNAVQIGLGMGLFYRYGYFSNPLPKENTVIKLAIDFSI